MAKRFQFRLETVLRVRDLHEQEAKRNVGAKQAEIAQLDQLNEQTREEILGRQDDIEQQQQAETIRPADLSRGRAWISQLRHTIAERLSMRQQLLSELNQLQTALREARVQRRVIEKLRERRWNEHSRRTNRSEQAAADELARQLQLHHSETPTLQRAGHA